MATLLLGYALRGVRYARCSFRKSCASEGCVAGKARSYRIHDAWRPSVGARLARADADWQCIYETDI